MENISHNRIPFLKFSNLWLPNNESKVTGNSNIALKVLINLQ